MKAKEIIEELLKLPPEREIKAEAVFKEGTILTFCIEEVCTEYFSESDEPYSVLLIKKEKV